MRKETPAKIIVVVLLILSAILTVLLVVYASRVKMPKLDLSGVLPESEDTTVTEESDEYPATEESDLASAPDRIEAEEGTLIPNEKYYLYDMSDVGANLVMYSNKPDYNWLGENDWAAFLYVDYHALDNVTHYDEEVEAEDVTTDTVHLFDKDVEVYIYPADDCITVVAAIFDDVVFEVQNYDAKDIETALQNFKSAADIDIVK